jgi:hypothetical protein
VAEEEVVVLEEVREGYSFESQIGYIQYRVLIQTYFCFEQAAAVVMADEAVVMVDVEEDEVDVTVRTLELRLLGFILLVRCTRKHYLTLL